MHLLIDSTGIKFLGEGEWKCKKHGAEYRRQWSKLHIGINADTLQIRAICVTSNSISDASVLGDLLEQLPADEALKSLIGDGAYDIQSLPTKWPSGTVVYPSLLHARMHECNGMGLFLSTVMQRLLDACIWKRWISYHRRSMVESKVN